MEQFVRSRYPSRRQAKPALRTVSVQARDQGTRVVRRAIHLSLSNRNCVVPRTAVVFSAVIPSIESTSTHSAPTRINCLGGTFLTSHSPSRFKSNKPLVGWPGRSKNKYKTYDRCGVALRTNETDGLPTPRSTPAFLTCPPPPFVTNSGSPGGPTKISHVRSCGKD